MVLKTSGVTSPADTTSESTRDRIIQSAAQIMREKGSRFVSYRNVSELAGVSHSLVKYYFDSIKDLLNLAARVNVNTWVERAGLVRDKALAMSVAELREKLIDILLEAVLPGDLDNMRIYLIQSLTLADDEEARESYRFGRVFFDKCVAEILRHAQVGDRIDAQQVVALIDGAAYESIAEGTDLREKVHELLESSLNRYPQSNR